MAEIISAIGEVVGAITGVIDLIKGVGKEVSEITDVFVQGGTEIIGFADAIKEPVEVSKGFLSNVFPSDIVAMFGIAFTVIIALATRRSVNA